eukprot:SM000100S09420  [mRNA]  locus=s100:256222:261671:- [translate_table: standard]
MDPGPRSWGNPGAGFIANPSLGAVVGDKLWDAAADDDDDDDDMADRRGGEEDVNGDGEGSDEDADEEDDEDADGEPEAGGSDIDEEAAGQRGPLGAEALGDHPLGRFRRARMASTSYVGADMELVDARGGGGLDDVVGRTGRGFDDLLALYGSADDDDLESNDSDYEPAKAHPRWYCTNCTMPNLHFEADTCQLCGEHRHSAILEEGFMAPPGLPKRSHVANANAGPSDLKPDPESLGVAADEDDERDEETPAVTAAQAVVTVAGLKSPHDWANAAATAVGFDSRMLMHEEGHMSPHPERPDRLRAIIGGLAAAGLFPGQCIPIPAREVTQKELLKVHSNEHVDVVESSCQSQERYFTPDTYSNQYSARAARLAAGSAVDLAVAIATGNARNGVALVRPPGHHAEGDAVMGFCLHNNVAVAARAAQEAGAKKVLIVDWDVHHGNGTQMIFEKDPSVLFISIHRHDGGHFYPGTGAAHEVGIGPGEGYSVNIPWSRGGIGDNDYLAAFFYVVLPIAYQFAPDLTIISAGFDAARGDPLGACDVTPEGYAHMASLLMPLAQGRMLVVLEGGYNLRSISASAAAVVKVLLGNKPPPVPSRLHPSSEGCATIAEVCLIQSSFWPAVMRPQASNHGGLHLGMDEERKEAGLHGGGLPSSRQAGASAAEVGFKKNKRKRKKLSSPIRKGGRMWRGNVGSCASKPAAPLWWKFGRRTALYNAWFLASRPSWLALSCA